MHIHNAENCSQIMDSGNNTTMMPNTGNTMMPGTGNNMSGGSMMPGSGNNMPGGNMMPGSGNNMSGGNMNNIIGHFNPTGMSHPFHAGDFPPLLSNQGYAWTAFFDRRFTLEEIIGKTVVIHAHADDFTSQPSGNPGTPIACGDIRRTF
ncbi:MAG: superoxide dismutase family protein [Lachnospiraceae bacterium]|nr:superoxide dismutase family protein [Lachnospiraceae bacterium]